jgi:para-nitrobenzyl esterase
MSSYWVNFAKTGDPNGPGLPEWPNFTGQRQESMHFDGTIHAIPTPLKKQLDFFEAWDAGQRR